MAIYGYNIINKVPNRKAPYYNASNGLFVFPVDTKYLYYIEASQLNEDVLSFYILLSTTKFDENALRTHRDEYGKMKIKVSGQLKEYIMNEAKYKANFNVTLVEKGYQYDVYKIE